MAHRILWRKLLGAVLFLSASGDAAAESAHEPTLEVRLEKDRLSVEVGAVPLVDVLNEIAEQTGAKLLVRGDPGTVQPQAFTGKPLAAGIRLLVEPNNLAMIFAPAMGPDAGPRLASLTVDASTTRSLGEREAEPIRRSSQANTQAPRAGLPSLSDFARGGDEHLVAALSRVLVGDPDALRQGIASERLDDAEAHRAALTSENPADRIEALQAIAERGSNGAIGPLFEVLVGDEDAAVRRTAVQILAGLDSEDALAALGGALSDPDPSVRAAAQQALKR
jgi:HEAT repeats